MRRTLLISAAALIALAVAGAPSSADPSATASAPVKVSAGDNFFSPAKAKVGAGGKVKWTNTGKIDHNVTFNGGFASGNFAPGASVVRKFNKPGLFPYSCTLHAGMKGKVRVTAAK